MTKLGDDGNAPRPPGDRDSPRVSLGVSIDRRRNDVDYDVIIVGAGPAGSSAAYELAHAGLRTALLDRQSIPRYKTCGGGLVGRAVRALPFSITSVVERECHAAQINVASAHFQHRCQRDGPIVTMVMRDRFDALLASNAANAGADLKHPYRVTGIETTRNMVTTQSPEGFLRARFVIAADGATGTVARAAGWPRHPSAVPAIEAEVEVAANYTIGNDARFDIHFVPHGYAWVFPKRRHLSVGVLTTRRGPSTLAHHLADYRREADLRTTTHEERHGYVIPIRPRTRSLVRGRTMVVGDAAGLADPITAEGISFAIRSGQLAARAIVAGNLEPRDVRARYHEMLERYILPELRVARFFARALYGFPRVARQFTLAHGEEFAEVLVDVMAGDTTFGTLLQHRAFRSMLRALHPFGGPSRSTKLDPLRQR